MKKIFLLSVLLFQLTFVFGQVKTENKKGYGMATGDYKPNRQETPTQNNNINKNDRSYQNSCYTGFAFTVKNYGYNKDGNHYSWGIKVKNNYTKPVSLRYKLIVGNDNTSPWAKYGTVTYNIKPGESYTNDYGTLLGLIVDSNSDQYRIEISEVCFEGQDCIKNGYADCNGKQSKTTNDKSTSTNSNNNSTNQQTTQQNDPTFDRNNASFQDYYKRATSAGQAGNYDEAISLWNSAIAVAVNDDQRNNAKAWLAEAEKAKNTSNNQKQNQEIANRNAEAQRQQQLLKQQQKTEAINQLTTTTVDLVTYFANRKNALRNSLSNEDGQALLDIVNSENPTNYTQNIIQIFTDLGYTLRKNERKDGVTYITFNNDVANINDLLFVFVHPSSYDYYNRISFDYHRKQKLREQLSTLGNNLKDKGSNGFEIEGISPNNKQKKIVAEEKKIKDKISEVKNLIEDFEKKDYWNSKNTNVFSIAKEIAEAYEDKELLNNPTESIRYYKKAASFTIDELSSNESLKFEKQMVDLNGILEGKANKKENTTKKGTYNEQELAKVYFKIAYLIEDIDGKDAIEWYIKSSNIFKINPYLNIARIYKNGLGGIEKDWNLAKEFYEKAAFEDDAKAMYNLGQLYENGGTNLKKDESKSKKWYSKACNKDKKYCN